MLQLPNVGKHVCLLKPPCGVANYKSKHELWDCPQSTHVCSAGHLLFKPPSKQLLIIIKMSQNPFSETWVLTEYKWLVWFWWALVSWLLWPWLLKHLLHSLCSGYLIRFPPVFIIWCLSPQYLGFINESNVFGFFSKEKMRPGSWWLSYETRTLSVWE